ncbi:unnamed protein product [Brassica napus]|uniref:(rape) hypothetical protein n=1 Tax=Brassica napus TaxID=3708 RepID=A0A816PN21_BRANA|nr:unnamed protein product [Brassica napus]
MLHLLPTDPAIYLLQILTLKALFKSILHDEAQRFLTQYSHLSYKRNQSR